MSIQIGWAGLSYDDTYALGARQKLTGWSIYSRGVGRKSITALGSDGQALARTTLVGLGLFLPRIAPFSGPLRAAEVTYSSRGYAYLVDLRYPQATLSVRRGKNTSSESVLSVLHHASGAPITHFTGDPSVENIETAFLRA